MSDISKIKLGNNTYNIKDQISRNGFASATLGTITQNNVEFSRLVFYDDTDTSAERNELGSVPLNNVIIPTLIGYNFGTNSVTMLGSGNTQATMTLGVENSKPVISFGSTTTGTSSGTATTVKLPVGKSGTIALVEDLPTGSNKFGFVDLASAYGNQTYDTIDFYSNEDSSTIIGQVELEDINIDTLTTQEATTKKLKFNDGITTTHQQGDLYANEANTSIIATGANTRTVQNNYDSDVHNKFEFKFGTSTEVSAIVELPMDKNGVIALRSDVTSAVSDVQDDVDALKTLLNVEGTDVQGTIDKYDEIVDFLNGLAETPTLVTQLADKVYTITYDETAASPSLQFKKTESGSATTVVTLDTTPTQNSKKPITSGGVYTAINALDTAAVKSITRNGKIYTPSSGTVALPDTVTKIQLNGKDQTLTPTASTGEGKVNLNNIPTKIKFNGTDYTATPNSSTGEGLVTINESDPVFSASPASGIVSADITNWNSALDDVQFTTSGSGDATKYLLQKKGVTDGSYTSFVELPKMIYTSSTETLEFIFAKAYSAS